MTLTGIWNLVIDQVDRETKGAIYDMLRKQRRDINEADDVFAKVILDVRKHFSAKLVAEIRKHVNKM